MPPVLQRETRLRSPDLKPVAAPNELTENAVAAVGASEAEKVPWQIDKIWLSGGACS